MRAQPCSSGDDHTCATVNGGLVCWGNNTQATLGNAASYHYRKFTSVFGGGGGSATLAFSAPVNTGGAASTQYTATWSK